MFKVCSYRPSVNAELGGEVAKRASGLIGGYELVDLRLMQAALDR